MSFSRDRRPLQRPQGPQQAGAYAAFRPHLRSRLTLGGFTFPRKP